MLGAATTIIPPEGELIAAEAAKSFLRIDGSELDSEIALTLAAAIEDLEALTGTRLLNQTIEFTADSFAELARLRVGPVREIVSITYRDNAGVGQALAAERYELFGAKLEQGIRPAGTSAWPATKAGEGMIIVRLEVGYGAAGDVPAKLRFAALALLRGKYEDREVDVEPLIANDRIWL